jgi:hypothetical protein
MARTKFFNKIQLETRGGRRRGLRSAGQLIERSASRSSIRDIGSARPRLRRVTTTFVRAIPPTRVRSLPPGSEAGEPREGEADGRANGIEKCPRAPLAVREKRARGHACVRAHVRGPRRHTRVCDVGATTQRATTYRPRPERVNVLCAARVIAVSPLRRPRPRPRPRPR